jgi:lipid II:glycine glycyltransferase (peptidoglycan interpeptide bridge formation enzyme)
MKIISIEDKQTWDAWVQQQENGLFLQSWNWGQFEQSLGNIVYYWGIFEAERMVGVSLIVAVRSKRGSYLECYGGPLFAEFTSEHLDYWLEEVTQLAHQTKSCFLRLRLPLPHTPENVALLTQRNFRSAPLHYQGELTRRIALTDSPDVLFAQFKKKTRYEIRRSLKEGVEIEEIAGHQTAQWETKFAIFLDLFHQMVQRQGYIGYSDTYLKKQFELFVNDNQAYLLLAQLNEQYIAGALFFRYGKITTYQHAASIPHPGISAPSVLIWHAIERAAQEGYEWFDLFGIVPPNQRRYKSRQGLTFFKEGFGGEEFQWLRTHDLVFDPLRYGLSWIIEIIPGHWRKRGSQFLSFFNSLR